MAGETSDADGALKIEHLVEPHADRRAAGALRSQVDLGRAILNAIYVASEFRSVVNSGGVMPPAELVQVLPIEFRAFEAELDLLNASRHHRPSTTRISKSIRLLLSEPVAGFSSR